MLVFPLAQTHIPTTHFKEEKIRRNIICYDVEKLNWLQLSALICVAFHYSSFLSLLFADVVRFTSYSTSFFFCIVMCVCILCMYKRNEMLKNEKCLRFYVDWYSKMNSTKTDDNFLLISYLFNLFEICRLRYRRCFCIGDVCVRRMRGIFFSNSIHP